MMLHVLTRDPPGNPPLHQPEVSRTCLKLSSKTQPQNYQNYNMTSTDCGCITLNHGKEWKILQSSISSAVLSSLINVST